MEIKIGVIYADDRALQAPQVLMLDSYLVMNGGVQLTKLKMAPDQLMKACEQCTTPQQLSFAFVFELVVTVDTTFKYVKTPSARTIMETLMGIPGFAKNNW